VDLHYFSSESKQFLIVGSTRSEPGIDSWNSHNAWTNSGSNWVPAATRIILSAIVFRATRFETSGMRIASKASAIERIRDPRGMNRPLMPYG
jgi:hypothetical protein